MNEDEDLVDGSGSKCVRAVELPELARLPDRLTKVKRLGKTKACR